MTMIDERELGGWRLPVLATAAATMLLPVVAIRGFEGAWDPPGDFMFLALLFGGVAISFEAAARIPSRNAYRAALGFTLAAALVHSWINLAVGIIGNEDNPANMIYYAVLAVALGGAILARFKPEGLSRAMVAAALAQVLVFVAALAAGLGFTGPITVFFIALWLTSAWLFRKATNAQSPIKTVP
jgi:hypothetical protein